MAGTQSFDVTTGCDLQEVDNAVNQAIKEINQRYDFKGAKVGIEFQKAEDKIVLTGPDDFKLKAMWEVLEGKMVRRNVPLKNLTPGKVAPGPGGTVQQEILLQQGLPGETAKAIVKFLKDHQHKRVQATIQGDQVRIASPSRDELQNVMTLLKKEDFGMELNFGNYRSI